MEMSTSFGLHKAWQHLVAVTRECLARDLWMQAGPCAAVAARWILTTPKKIDASRKVLGGDFERLRLQLVIFVCFCQMDYDSDSSAGDDGPYTETNVLLGFPTKDPADTASHLGGVPVCTYC
jgi:hypothetical protein